MILSSSISRSCLRWPKSIVEPNTKSSLSYHRLGRLLYIPGTEPDASLGPITKDLKGLSTMLEIRAGMSFPVLSGGHKSVVSTLGSGVEGVTVG